MLTGSNSAFLNMAESIALTHHEKFDGTGYPRGLRGENIPLVGRITAVADVFDALTSQRPYKEPWGLDHAFAEIKAMSGKNFDPKVVDAFYDAKKEIEEIYRAHQ